jgi:glycosyltransferase involved in cell wall biosynthesis
MEVIISVVIPAYNAERTILETIHSVQQQDFSGFEIIVIDDGSTDNTLNILNSINDARLKIFSYPNGGVSVARNRGISHSQGQFIALLDADDLWTPDKLSLQLQTLQLNPSAGVVYSWTRFMDEHGKSFYDDKPLFYKDNVYSQLLVSNFIASGSNPLIRREALKSVGEFDPALSHCEDWDMYLRLAEKWSFAVVPKPQIFYRQLPGSGSSKFDALEKGGILTIEKAFKSAPPELQHLKKKSLAQFYQFLAKLCLTNYLDSQRILQAKKHLKVAIHLNSKLFFTINAQKLILKLIFFQSISPKLLHLILKQVSRFRSIPIRDIS